MISTYMYVTPRAIESDNVGHTMLLKMGWHGAGLGRQEHGQTDPVSSCVSIGPNSLVII